MEDNIRTADRHKSFDPVLAERIQYKSSSLEEIVEESMETFDVIVASEVVEHVADLETFIKSCSQVLKVREFLLSLLGIFILFYYCGFLKGMQKHICTHFSTKSEECSRSAFCSSL